MMKKGIIHQEEARDWKDWLGKILSIECKVYQDFFGREFDLAGFRAILEECGHEKISQWQALGLEPHFLPPVAMAQDANFPGWEKKPEKWYYEKVAEGEILRRQPDGSLIPDREAFHLHGITVLVDVRLKPQYKDGKQMFENDNLLGPIIKGLRQAGKIAKYEHGPQSSRFGVSVDEWEDQIKPVLTEFLEVEVDCVRLERAIEANVIPQLYPYIPRKSDGETNVWVWYEEYFEGASFRLDGGDSDYGGLAHVDYGWAAYHWCHRAFRPLVVLGS